VPGSLKNAWNNELKLLRSGELAECWAVRNVKRTLSGRVTRGVTSPFRRRICRDSEACLSVFNAQAEARSKGTTKATDQPHRTGTLCVTFKSGDALASFARATSNEPNIIVAGTVKIMNVVKKYRSLVCAFCGLPGLCDRLMPWRCPCSQSVSGINSTAVEYVTCHCPALQAATVHIRGPIGAWSALRTRGPTLRPNAR